MSDKEIKDEQEREVFLYNLTDMTGKGAQEDRRHVHFTIEMRRATRNANILAVLVTAISMLISFPIVRVIPLVPIWSFLVIGMVVYALVLWAMLYRSRRGLRVAQWQAFWDRRRAQVGVFIQYGTVVDPLASTPLRIVPAGTPNTLARDWDTELILEEVTE
ncbi:hypothetical protein [Brachybacterium sp. GPGPB12]|uniref:hypothetical protein n=1 Tax=Brachybacterium sp. GPGPB12 TaxID=3023517 RepID=UPI00313438D3